MNKEEAIHLLTSGMVSAFNQYREMHPDYIPDFSKECLNDVKLNRVNLSKANLREATFSGLLRAADLSAANLCGADLSEAYLDTYVPGRKNRDRAILTGAKYDKRSKFPPGFDAATVGALYQSESESIVSHVADTIFISYAWVNSDVVLAIDTWLRKKGLNTKMDRRDFFAGSRIQNEIIRTMSSCNTILLFHSRQSIDKPWVEFERELASDLEIAAKTEKRPPPRRVYVVVDDAPLPNITDANRVAIFAKGKRFQLVCEEIYHAVLRLPKKAEDINLNNWDNYMF